MRYILALLAIACGGNASPERDVAHRVDAGSHARAPQASPEAPSGPVELVWQLPSSRSVSAAAVDRHLLATVQEGTVFLRDLRTYGQIASRGLAAGAAIEHVQVCAAQSIVALREGKAESEIQIWNARANGVTRAPGGAPFAFSPSCNELASIVGDAATGFNVSIWDLASRTERLRFPLTGIGHRSADTWAFAMRYSPSGDTLAVTLRQHVRPDGTPSPDTSNIGQMWIVLFDARTAHQRQRAVVESSYGTETWLLWSNGDRFFHAESTRMNAATGATSRSGWARYLAIDHGGYAVRVDGGRAVITDSAGDYVLGPPGPEYTDPFDDSETLALLPRPDAAAVLSNARGAWLWSASGVAELASSEADVAHPKGDCRRGLGVVPSIWDAPGSDARPPCLAEARGMLWNRAVPIVGTEGMTENAAVIAGPLFAGSARRDTRIGSFADGTITRRIAGGSWLRASPTGRYLVVGQGRTRAMLVDLRGERRDRDIDDVYYAEVHFSDREEVAAFVSRHAERGWRLKFVDVATGNVLSTVAQIDTVDGLFIGTRMFATFNSPRLTVYSVDSGRPLTSRIVPSRPIVSADASTLLFCGGTGIEMRDPTTLAVRRTLPLVCTFPFYAHVSPDGRLLTLSNDQRVVRLTDGASLTLSTMLDELGVHHVAYAPSGVFWAHAEDLEYLSMQQGGQSTAARDAAPRFFVRSLLSDFFAGRPLPRPAAQPRAIDAPLAPRTPRPITPARNERIDVRHMVVRWAHDVSGARGRVCRDPQCRSVIVSGLRNHHRLPDGPAWPAVAYLSIVSGGHSSVPLRFEIEPPPERPFTTEPMLELTQPTSDPLTIRFRPGGPTWTAQLFACDGPHEPFHLDGPGCGALRLTSEAETRFMTVDLDRESFSPSLHRIARPDGNYGLVLTEERDAPAHESGSNVHLFEDEGRGPRLVLRVKYSFCDGSSCGEHSRARYVDANHDGALDLVLSWSMREGPQSITFVRRGDRFAPSEELFDDDQFGLVEDAPE